jgi:hypothetical protein
MNLDADLLVAIVGICIAATGLFLNALALRRNNEIAVSTKLAEASKLLSDELVAAVTFYQLCNAELRGAEANPQATTETGQTKIVNLKSLIDNSLARQREIDKESEQIDRMFSNLSNVHPGEIDAMITRSYRLQAKAKGSLKYAKDLSEKPSEGLERTRDLCG